MAGEIRLSQDDQKIAEEALKSTPLVSLEQQSKNFPYGEPHELIDIEPKADLSKQPRFGNNLFEITEKG